MKLKPIKDKKKIKQIFDKGLLIRGDVLSIKFFDFNDNGGGYGISVPKKKIRRAVDRNLLKRRLRRCLDDWEPLNLLKGKSFFLIYMSDEVLSSSEISRKLSLLK